MAMKAGTSTGMTGRRSDQPRVDAAGYQGAR